jgi:hypothetical protein
MYNGFLYKKTSISPIFNRLRTLVQTTRDATQTVFSICETLPAEGRTYRPTALTPLEATLTKNTGKGHHVSLLTRRHLCEPLVSCIRPARLSAWEFDLT